MFDKGNVEITLAGEKITLKSTPFAMRQISQILGGTVGAYRQLAEQNVDAFIVVIAAGTGKDARNNKIADDIADKIFASGGTADLFDAVFLYCQTCLAGGRPPKAEGEGDGDSEQGENPTTATASQ